MKIVVVSPTYHRVGRIDKLLKYYPFIRFYTDYNEFYKYIEYYPNNKHNFVQCPQGIQGNNARVRNYILDVEFNYYENDAVISFDDDVFYLIRWKYSNEKNKFVYEKIETEELGTLFENLVNLTNDFGFKLFGVSASNQPIYKSNNNLFTFHSGLEGSFMGFIKNPIRIDETIPALDDILFSAEHIRKYGGLLKFNNLGYIKNHEFIDGFEGLGRESQADIIKDYLDKHYFLKKISTTKIEAVNYGASFKLIGR